MMQLQKVGVYYDLSKSKARWSEMNISSINAYLNKKLTQLKQQVIRLLLPVVSTYNLNTNICSFLYDIIRDLFTSLLPEGMQVISLDCYYIIELLLHPIFTERIFLPQ